MGPYEKLLIEVITYILAAEEEDFNRNPSTNHIYYKAYILYYGKENADDMLENTLEEREKYGNV